MTQRINTRTRSAHNTAATARSGLSGLGGMILQNVFAIQLVVILTSVVGYGVSMM